MKKTLLLALFILASHIADAQTLFTISGNVVNSRGEALQAATVFIDGTQKTTVTDDKGNFNFSHMGQGTYQVVVNLIGYESVKSPATVKYEAVDLKIILQEKQIALAQVNIGDDSQRKGFMKIFTKYFMGESENAKACKISNPEVIDFATEQTLIKATTDKFLVIENQNLGYRINYLLRNFRYDKKLETTIYDGECIFEQLTGTDLQRQKWVINRKKAYEGSLMHYLIFV
ncbi:MAG: carboxypeptidase-like regulatory domain-containing protein [Bacteroidota bacterium]